MHFPQRAKNYFSAENSRFILLGTNCSGKNQRFRKWKMFSDTRENVKNCHFIGLFPHSCFTVIFYNILFRNYVTYDLRVEHGSVTNTKVCFVRLLSLCDIFAIFFLFITSVILLNHSVCARLIYTFSGHAPIFHVENDAQIYFVPVVSIYLDNFVLK